jgi:hypothetical protein
VAGIVNGAVSLRRQALDNGPSLSSLAAVPGALGLVVPAAQTVAGAAMLLGIAAVNRLRRRYSRKACALDTGENLAPLQTPRPLP